MINKIKLTTKHTAIYSLGNMTTKLVGLILLPLYTDRLSVDEYGILSILEVTAQIGMAIFAFQLQAAFLRWCSAKTSESEFKSIVFSVLSIFLMSAGLILLIFIPNAGSFSTLFFGSEKFSEYFVLLSFAIGLSILNLHPLTLLRIQQRSVFYAGASIVKLVIMLGLNIYFVGFLGWGIKGILLGQIAGQASLQILTLGIVFKNISFRFYTAGFADMLRFSFPLIFTGVASLLLNMGDRFLIKYFLDEASVGVYSLGQKISSVLNMLLLQSFTLGFQPIAYKMAEQPNAKRYFSKVLTYFTFVLVISALGLSVFSREFIRFMASDRSYWEAFIFVPLLTLGFVFRGMSSNISIAFYIIKKTTYNAIIVIGGLIVSVLLNLLLLPSIGVIGSAVSMMVSGFLMACTAYLIGRRVYPIPFELTKLFMMIILGALLYYLSSLTNGLDLPIRLALKFLILVLFPFVLYIFNFYEKVELEYFAKGFRLISSPSKLLEFIKTIKL